MATLKKTIACLAICLVLIAVLAPTEVVGQFGWGGGLWRRGGWGGGWGRRGWGGGWGRGGWGGGWGRRRWGGGWW